MQYVNFFNLARTDQGHHRCRRSKCSANKGGEPVRKPLIMLISGVKWRTGEDESEHWVIVVQVPGLIWKEMRPRTPIKSA